MGLHGYSSYETLLQRTLLFWYNLLPLESSPLRKGAELKKESNRGNGEEADREE